MTISGLAFVATEALDSRYLGRRRPAVGFVSFGLPHKFAYCELAVKPFFVAR